MTSERLWIDPRFQTDGVGETERDRIDKVDVIIYAIELNNFAQRRQISGDRIGGWHGGAPGCAAIQRKRGTDGTHWIVVNIQQGVANWDHAIGDDHGRRK